MKDLENLIIKSKYDGILMTGFNRRFSPHAKYLASLIENSTDQRSNFILNYRMNAGFIPYDHWVHSSEGGGRNIGEACHIYDLFTFLAKSKVKKISVSTIEAFRNFRKNDNLYLVSLLKEVLYKKWFNGEDKNIDSATIFFLKNHYKMCALFKKSQINYTNKFCFITLYAYKPCFLI